MHRDFVPDFVLNAAKRNPTLHRTARGARRAIGRLLPPRRYEGIPGRIHPNDYMFARRSSEEVASYSERALNVIGTIDAALTTANLAYDHVGRWLDFGCGYGRVIRYLVQRVPPERVWASDVVREGVDFCASEFQVNPLHSHPDLATVRLPSFDFIYAISVLSHMNERNSIALLRLLGESLEPGGIALFTTHGAWSLENLATYGAEYEQRREEIGLEVQRSGSAFVRYPYLRGDDYGMAWHSREYVEKRMSELHEGRLKLLLFAPHGLDGHQDVYAFQRAE